MEQKTKRTIRAVGYVDRDEYQEFMDILKESDLTFSSWLRKTIKRTVKRRRINDEAARQPDDWDYKKPE